MRPLEGPSSTYPAFAREGTLALLRVPGLSADHGPDAAEMLSEGAWGRPLLAKSHGRTDDGTAALDLVDAETGVSMGVEMVRAGLARIARTEARRVRRRAGITAPVGNAAGDEAARAAAEAGDADLAYLLKLEEAQKEAKEAREGM
jgi:hypothetical protein